MSVLRFYKNYNNYANNIEKDNPNIVSFMGYTYEELADTNFNPNDDVITEHIVNWSNTWTPDYMIVVSEPNILTPSILSRWFVTESVRTRKNQYRFTFRRDAIAEQLANNYDEMINAPILVERAMITDVNNPLLYNPEGFKFNQIKKEERLIKDGTGSAWYILYFKKGLASKQITFNPKPGIEDFTIGTPITQSIFATEGHLYKTSNIVPMITFQTDGGQWGSSWCDRVAILPNKLDFYEVRADDPIWFNQTLRTVKSEFTVFDNQYQTLSSNALTDEGLSNQITTQQEQYLSWDGKLVKDSNNQLYRVHVLVNPTSEWKYKTSGDMVDTMKALINGTSLTRSGDWGDNAFAVKYDNIEYTFSYDPEPVVDPTGFQITIDWSNKQTTANSDYNILAIPYNKVIVSPNPQNEWHIIPEWSKAFLQAIMGAYTNEGELVDIQLLPYFPIVRAQESPIRSISPSEVELVKDSQSLTDSIGVFYISDANFTFNKTLSLTASNDYIERKIQNETQTVRLCSPNYNGVFEFNVAKNGGVDYLNIDVTLKPYNPYIHINPNFKNLYGQDFDDAKGLICGGDFSIPIWSTAWQQYQLNNKNYQNIFDRQIQNLDFTQGQERTLAGWNIATGTVTGTSTGAMAGFMAGGGYGAIAGGVLGGTSSLAAGIADYSMLSERQAEQKDLTTDMFRFQLGNIKALPYSLNKVTPLTYNNKIFPFIEIYDCTDEEKNVFRNFLTYQSMSINAVGTLTDYWRFQEKTFIKGRLIRLENSDLCSHEWMEIYNRLAKGVYI